MATMFDNMPIVDPSEYSLLIPRRWSNRSRQCWAFKKSLAVCELMDTVSSSVILWSGNKYKARCLINFPVSLLTKCLTALLASKLVFSDNHSSKPYNCTLTSRAILYTCLVPAATDWHWLTCFRHCNLLNLVWHIICETRIWCWGWAH